MAQMRDWVVRLAFALSILLVGYFVVAALGVRFGYWGVAVGFGSLTLRLGPMLAFGALALAAVAVLLALLVKPRRGTALALAAALLPAVLVGGLLQFRASAQGVPPIHDISTDLIDPPGFSAKVVAERTAQGANSLDLPNKRVPELGGRFGAAEGLLSVDLQRQDYSDIVPVALPMGPADAFAPVAQIAGRLGWTVTRQDASAGMIEAQVRSFWFGFIDDIVIRIRPAATAGESLIDIRSVSRVGISDVGANAKRVRAFSEALIAQLGGRYQPAAPGVPPIPCCAAPPGAPSAPS